MRNFSLMFCYAGNWGCKWFPVHVSTEGFTVYKIPPEPTRQIPLYVLHFIPHRVILNLQILYVPGAQYRPLAWHTWRIRYFSAMAFHFDKHENQAGAQA